MRTIWFLSDNFLSREPYQHRFFLVGLSRCADRKCLIGLARRAGWRTPQRGVPTKAGIEKRFSFFAVRQKLAPVRAFLAVAFLVMGPIALRAQEVTLPPIVVTETFELRQGPSITDLFTQHLQRQIETKRVLEDAAASSPILNARFWRYLPPLQNCSGDSSQFFTPNYLTLDYRNAERALQESRKHSLFDGR